MIKEIILTSGNLPSVVFALRFSNEAGFVQQFFAKQRDFVARKLQGVARCLLAYKRVGKNPVYAPNWAEEVQLDFYDNAPENKEAIRKFITSHNVRVVVFQSANLDQIDLKFLRKLNIRTVNTEDDSFDPTRTQSMFLWTAKLFMRTILKLGVHDMHIANSKGQYEFLRRFSLLPQRRLRTIPYGVDMDHFRPGNRAVACAELGLDPNTVWIMAAAQARPEKRVHLLIDVVRMVKEARPHAPVGFFYVGDGVMLEQWREHVRSLPSAAQDYRFFGKQTNLRPYYQAASIFVHGASRESFGLVLVEAMASGLPVIATRADGPAEIVRNGVTGYLIERDDWKTFADAILSYIDNPELMQNHGLAGRQRSLANWSPDREATEIASVILPYLQSNNVGYRR